MGELFLSGGEIAEAWRYLRATGYSSRVAEMIEKVEPGDDVNWIIEIAFQEGVHPAKGLELIATKYGICRALTRGEFVTYGVGVPLLTMRQPEAVRGRAPV